jgi:hypothetical protein
VTFDVDLIDSWPSRWPPAGHRRCRQRNARDVGIGCWGFNLRRKKRLESATGHARFLHPVLTGSREVDRKPQHFWDSPTGRGAAQNWNVTFALDLPPLMATGRWESGIDVVGKDSRAPFQLVHTMQGRYGMNAPTGEW